MSIYTNKIDGAPQFVSFFKPIIETLKKLGGEASSSEVIESLVEAYPIPDEIKSLVNKNGRPTFENRIAWGRFYLTKAGYMYSPRRGVWALSENAENLIVDDSKAVEIFKNGRSAFKADEDEDKAPQGEIIPDGPSYWFVGARWGDEDQVDKFLKENIWQNGYTDKFNKLVKQMKPGDKIAIKSAFTRKKDVPFENNGGIVSVMRIKATGTITKNRGDGQTVEVDWTELETPRDWYFYTYLTTIVKAKVYDEPMAKRLVDFTFNGSDQDYGWFLSNPFWGDRYKNTHKTFGIFEDDDDVETTDGGELLKHPYGVENIIDEGSFLSAPEIKKIIGKLEQKKNLILQGPPGTGKTWLAKRLAKALIGEVPVGKDQIRSVQFHPSLSYEDFVRGYRPHSEGGLRITDGVFLQVIEAALSQPDTAYVLVIEEINRGNPAQIFGEMLTLLENTKRSRADAIELAYRKTPRERVFVPENLHIIGTMNIADRSLALVDLALRRRFAFVTLEPLFNDVWQAWCIDRGLESDFITKVRSRLEDINRQIADDRTLGPQYRIGHSYVTPHEEVLEPVEWYKDIVVTEIKPLLEEYWYESHNQVEEAISGLLSRI